MRMAEDGALGEGTGNQGFWRADLELFLQSLSPLPMNATLNMFQGKANPCWLWILASRQTEELGVFKLIVITVIYVIGLTTNAQWTVCGSVAITCIISCARLTWLEELLPTGWNSAQLLDYELSPGVLMVIKQPVLLSMTLLSKNSCKTSWAVSLVLSRSSETFGRVGTEEYRLWGLRNGSDTKPRSAVQFPHSCLYFCRCVSPPNFLSPPSNMRLETFNLESWPS